MKWHNKIPKTILVGPSTITIKLISYRKASQNNIYGHYIDEDQVIELDSDLREDLVKLYLLHELMHVIFRYQCMSNIELMPASAKEEFIVDNMSKGLMAVIKANPELMKFING